MTSMNKAAKNIVHVRIVVGKWKSMKIKPLKFNLFVLQNLCFEYNRLYGNTEKV